MRMIQALNDNVAEQGARSALLKQGIDQEKKCSEDLAPGRVIKW
jgi:hypothetical protein